jgi:hypothetical protein
MSFSVQRHAGDKRQLGRLALPVLALVDMVAERDWERVVSLAETIATEARAELVQMEIKKAESRNGVSSAGGTHGSTLKAR